MRPYTSNMDGDGGFDVNRPRRTYLAGDDASPSAIARQQHAAVTGLIDALKREREAILSLSLNAITETNREKEEALRTLANLRKPGEDRHGRVPDDHERGGRGEDPDLAGMIEAGLREAQKHIRRNRVLLSLSAGRVRSAMEFIAHSLKERPLTYGRESKNGPMLFSRRV